MRLASPIFALAALTACTVTGTGPEPSLAPRAAEAIDPRVPVPASVPTGSVDAALAVRLAQLIGEARAGQGAFEAQRMETARLASTAGAQSSESWIVAQQSLSRLSALHGVTARAAADIDALAAIRLQQHKYIRPADAAAISAAAAEVGEINDSQAAAIASLGDRLAR